MNHYLWAVNTFTYTECLIQDKDMLIGGKGGKKEEKKEQENKAWIIIYLPHFKEYHSHQYLYPMEKVLNL